MQQGGNHGKGAFYAQAYFSPFRERPHELKGAAGTLAAIHIQAAAEVLELALRRDGLVGDSLALVDRLQAAQIAFDEALAGPA